MFPVPLAAGTVAPPVVVAVHDAPGSALMVSATVAPVTLLGPLLLNTITYVCVLPAAAVLAPLVLLTARSADGDISVLVAVIVLLAVLVSVVVPVGLTVAVLARLPVAVAATVPLTW